MILWRLPANFPIGCHVFGRLSGPGYMQNHWYFIGFTAIWASDCYFSYSVVTFLNWGVDFPYFWSNLTVGFHISARLPRCCNDCVTLPSQLHDRMPRLWTTSRSWDPCKNIGIPLVLLLSERRVAISVTLVERFPIPGWFSMPLG